MANGAVEGVLLLACLGEIMWHVVASLLCALHSWGTLGLASATMQHNLQCLRIATAAAASHRVCYMFSGLWRGSTVAVKTMILPAKMSGAEKRERMAIMEAAISSTMNHPNIGESWVNRQASGGCYYVRPCLCGRALYRATTRKRVPSSRFMSFHGTAPLVVMLALCCMGAAVDSGQHSCAWACG